MAKKYYIGVDGVARKIKKCYIGVDGVARKVVKGYVGVENIAREFIETIEVGHYWLIDLDGTKEYMSNGTLVTSSINRTSWVCPTDGTYSIELHGQGGSGGSSQWVANSGYEGSTWVEYYAAASGGGGGGSGLITSAVLTGGLVYSCSIDSTTTFDNLSCGPGGNGTNGSASAEMYSGPRYNPGVGGRASGGLASEGAKGTGYARTNDNPLGVQGAEGGSGGSTIGSYGNGGAAGKPWVSGGVNSGSYSFQGYNGNPGAIIIRKTS